MKTIAKTGLCVLLILGLAISAFPSFQENETQREAQEKQSSEIKQLTIRNSGFRSKSTVIIRYRDEDKKIVEVIENGKKLPPEEFSRYESIIRDVLEIPQIDRLLPEIERARRIAESQRISKEYKIREMLQLRHRMEGLESDAARRYRNWSELQLMETLNRLTQDISESRDLSNEEKIARLKEIIEKIRAIKLTEEERIHRSGLVEFGEANAARSLIEEINKSSSMSKEEKINEIKDVLQKLRERDIEGEERHRNLIEIETAEVLRKMLQETAQRKDLSDQEKEKEMESLLQEAQSLKLEGIQRMVGIEKFKFDLHRMLEDEGLLPEGKAEFVLTAKECSIDGRKLPKDIRERIMKLCEESLGMKFSHDTKIILQLNEDR